VVVVEKLVVDQMVVEANVVEVEMWVVVVDGRFPMRW
jgi:hypothetical protein